MSTESNTQAQDNAQDQTGGEDLSVALSAARASSSRPKRPSRPSAREFSNLLLLLAIGGGGTYLTVQAASPAAASAASVETAARSRAINNFLTNRPERDQDDGGDAAQHQKIVQQFLEYPAFRSPLEFSTHQPVPLRQSRAVAERPTRCSEKEEGRRTHGRQWHASQSLTLQSIIHSGARKACMINNTLYLEGQQVDPFTIEKITPNSVVVKTGVYRFELRMQK